MKKIELNETQIINAKNILEKYRLGFAYDESNDCFEDEIINKANDKYNLVLSSTGDIKKAKESKKVFLNRPYDSFSQNRDDAFKFAEHLNVSVCPYCNEQFIYTVFTNNKKPVSRPEFDHFKKKSKYPKLQLSLFNLVPSCHTCNSTLKGQKEFDETTHINPYKANFDEIMKFDLKLIGADYLDPDNFKIIFKPSKKSSPFNKLAKNNIQDFKLIERYQCHKHEVIKLAKAKKIYDKMKKKEIADIFFQSNICTEAILFPDKDCEINKTILGKLKRDISNKFINC